MKLDKILVGHEEGHLPVACQGVDCSYSSMACNRAFIEPEIHFYPNFEDVFVAVSQGDCPYGVIPIENTLAGSVTENYDLMLEHNLVIVGSVTIPVDHCLLTLPGAKLEELSTLLSHPQALHQCSEFFKTNKHLAPREFSNTAAAAQYVAEQNDPALGAIGSSACAEKYGLEIYAKGIQNRKKNFTRFLVIGRENICTPECNRMSMVFRLNHKPGSLIHALNHFAERNINLLKLESRPIPESPFEFVFYCDFSGNYENADIQSAMGRLPMDLIYMKFLGNYPDIAADI